MEIACKLLQEDVRCCSLRAIWAVGRKECDFLASDVNSDEKQTRSGDDNLDVRLIYTDRLVVPGEEALDFIESDGHSPV